MIPTGVEELYRKFWDIAHLQFNLSTTEGCGLFTEAWVKYAQNHNFPKVGHLKKNTSQTQYNGHAVDAFLYAEPYDAPDNMLFQAVDIIGGAEGPNPQYNYGIDIPRYKMSDWLKEPNGESQPSTVPYKAYEGDEYWNNQVGKILFWDYTDKTRANKPLDSMSSVWTARTIHDIKMEGLTPQQSVDKHRIEWCAELKIPVVPYPENL